MDTKNITKTGNKLEKYLSIFGLRRNFTLEELTASFRTLAKLNHPDVSGDADTAEIMSDINEGYRFLKDVLSEGGFSGAFEGEKEQEKERALDIFYDQYKRGFIILKNAFDGYYGDSEDKSKSGDSKILKIELLRAKIEFAVLINDLPYNQWVNDAIDKINSINKWLK